MGWVTEQCILYRPQAHSTNGESQYQPRRPFQEIQQPVLTETSNRSVRSSIFLNAARREQPNPMLLYFFCAIHDGQTRSSEEDKDATYRGRAAEGAVRGVVSAPSAMTALGLPASIHWNFGSGLRLGLGFGRSAHFEVRFFG